MDQEKAKELVNQLKFYINESGIPESVIYIAAVAAVVILFRRILCWYLRQNEIVVLLKEIRDLLTGGDNTEVKKPGEFIKQPTKQAIQNKGPIFVKPDPLDSLENEERLDGLFNQPLNDLSEHNLKELISITHKTGQYEKCNEYLECIITKYPDSPYVNAIAKDRLKEISAKLGQQLI